MERTGLFWSLAAAMAISALFFPFWATVLIFLAALVMFDDFYIGLVILCALDAVYGFETFRVGPLYGMVTMGGIALFFLMRFIKNGTSIVRR